MRPVDGLGHAGGPVVTPEARRAQAPFGRGRRRAILLVCGILAVIAGGMGVTFSPVFALAHVRVEGASHVSSRQVVRAAGLAGGTNVFWLHTGAVERRVEALAWVAGAEVTKSLPGTVTIVVRERVPVGAVDRGGSYDLIAGDGTILGPVPGNPKLPLITIRTTPGGPVSSSARGPISSSARGPAVVLAALPADVRADVVTAGEEGGQVTLALRPGVTVLVGSPTDLEAKAQALASVLAWASRHGARLTQVDVRTPAAPAARLVTGVPAGL